MIHWKFIAVCAAGAALLSFVAGLFGRVAAGALFFRAILSAIVFGGLAVGLEVLGRKFLPELFSGPDSVDNDTEEASASGGGVDIVVDDDDEPVSFAPTGAMEGIIDDADEAVIEADEAEEFEDLSGADDVEAAEPVSETGSPSKGAAGSESAGDDAATPEEVPAAAPPATAKNDGGLPNIEEFSGSFGDIGGGASGVDSLDSGKAKSLEAIDSLGGENDPATMAQAIRSMVQKDQEG